MSNTKDTEAISMNITPESIDPAAPRAIDCSQNITFPDSDSSIFQKPFRIPKSNASSIFGHMTPLQGSDTTLSRDYEIPWVPHIFSQETESYGADITFADFFDFVEQNPSTLPH
jgi:hypothetical protein